MRTGVANVPLHGGHCPPWLFEKMKKLGAAIIQVIVMEYGSAEVLRRLSDPVWFQSFGSVLGFDWHSSGLTTVVTGALKEGLGGMQGELGLFFAGGKGKTSRKTPLEILEAGEKYGLVNDLQQLQRTSRLVAKVDSAAVQDGYQLYHHFFVFDRDGNWAVVQQGMNEETRYARRYHWLSERLNSFVEDPHQAVVGRPEAAVLNLVSRQNLATRMASVELCRERPEQIGRILQHMKDRCAVRSSERSRQVRQSGHSRQLSLFSESDAQSPSGMEESDLSGDWTDASANGLLRTLSMPRAHPIPSAAYLNKVLRQLYECPPENYEQLLDSPGVGPSTLRALAMVAEVTHGAGPSFHDPVRYAFAHGGKDGFPFPVQRSDIEHSLQVLRTAIEKGKIGELEKLEALRKLARTEDKWIQGSSVAPPFHGKV